MTPENAALKSRYLHDAEFHAAVHVYATRKRGVAEWATEGDLLADAQAVVDLEAAGMRWTLDA